MAAPIKLTGDLQWEDDIIAVNFASFSSLPQTKSNSAITANHILLSSTLGTPSVQTGDWTVTTSAGQVQVSGTISGSTTLFLVLGRPKATVS